MSDECILPEKPLHINIIGVEGYETFAIDSNSIGVRPKWISVNDKLPENWDPVLAYAKNNQDSKDYRFPYLIGNYFEAYYHDGIWEECVDGCRINVSHWTLLPEPPKE